MEFTSDRTEKHVLTGREYDMMEIPLSKRDALAKLIPDTKARATIVGYGKKCLDMAHGGFGLWLLGKPSTGKTSAAVALAKLFRQHKFWVYYTTVADLRDNTRRRRPWDDDESSPVDRARDCEILVLDDLTPADVARDTGALNAVDLRTLLHHRHENNLVTLLVSTGTIEDFADASPAFMAEVFKKDVLVSMDVVVPTMSASVLKFIQSK